jgi:hypothetical protein
VSAAERDNVHRLIIDEIDQARDVLQLVTQLERALPLKSAADLRKVADEKGHVQFRDGVFDIAEILEVIPDMAFPIEDVRSLVERVALLVSVVPEHLGVDINSPDRVKRRMRRQLVSGMKGVSLRAGPGGPLVGPGRLDPPPERPRLA